MKTVLSAAEHRGRSLGLNPFECVGVDSVPQVTQFLSYDLYHLPRIDRIDRHIHIEETGIAESVVVC